ncbi:hypothetical protein BDV95DRAFT_558606 [Massariosphaeria phaeospora]|uniref:1-phosphatidylinositol-3-phosphate 5-kinase n=1 Tax=Massariosphaeria phaeospora TaxID=100035 RepID=A0A7C8II47_9PLEO|nr:hypothetical protein BDV95DRAFT_558606 [Massariosphaeria phaeospora]
MPKDTGEPRKDALHQMHAAASRSETLTTFDDLTTPPASASASEPKGIELVPGGFSGLYSRIKASVGGVKEGVLEAYDDGARSKAVAKAAAHPPKSPAGTAVSSPVIVSVPSSRLQSPLIANFPEKPLPPSRDSNISTSAVSGRPSLNESKVSLATTRSRPSIAPSIEHAKSSREDEAFSTSPVGSSLRAHGNATTASASKNNPSGKGKDFSKIPPGRDELFRQQKGDIDPRDQGSDTAEDEIVMIESGGFPNDNAKFAFATDPDRTSRADSHYMSAAPPSRDTRNHSDNSSETTQVPHVTASAQTSVLAPAPQRPPLVHVGASHLPGFRPSRASSSDALSSSITSNAVRSNSITPIQETREQVSANRNLPKNTFSQIRRRVLDREFWMRDENAKDCFNCGDTFSTFRRKHHCRTCGQIFDGKCTSLVSGQVFGLSATVRVCKPCEAIIYGNDQDSSDYTDEGSIYEKEGVSQVLEAGHFDLSESDHAKIGTPTISIPMSRKAGSEKKRRSAVIEVAAPTLARPSSSRSLRSLGGRPRSSSHKRHHSRHQHMRNVRYEDRAPFHQHETDHRSRSTLPAFHHDNIIDPDLAAFMSDEDSSEDEQASIFATIRGDSPSHTSMEGERSGIGGLLAAMRKGKSRAGERSVMGGHTRDSDNISITSRVATRHTRRRNLSVSSTHRPSPKRTKSNSLLRPFSASFGGSSSTMQPNTPQAQPSPAPPTGLEITRSVSMQSGQSSSIELNDVSLNHVRQLLRQMLHDAAISHVSSWEKALVPILLQCTDDVNPDVHKTDDMDIRHYIKLKKIPGGKPRDTLYVCGVVFTKNIALKSMPRLIRNPRIIIVTFAIEYARHQQHFMSLEPVIAQEREYLRNLVSRIIALQPHVLLVQRNVSGLALEFLEQAGIAVAYNVKETVLNAVARCTRSPMISSVDKLTMNPHHLGRCESFEVKTYLHKNIKRTYIYLSGCQRDLGCTIVLRGAETESLIQLKRIAEFMCYVVYNLKLETCLVRDEFVLIPAASSDGSPVANQTAEQCTQCASAKHEHENHGVVAGVSAAPGPSPHTVEDHLSLHGTPAPSYYSEMVENHRTRILSASPFVKFSQPYLLNQAREYEKKLGLLKKLRDQYTTDEGEGSEQSQLVFNLVQPEMVHTMPEQASKQVREFLHAVHAAEYDKALHNYQTQKRQWEAYLSGNMDLFDPFNHQKIAVLYSVVNSVTSTPCIGPEIIALGFYTEHDFDDGFTPDCTLGQYVEDLCHSAGVLCAAVDGCNRRMLDHHRQYVHGEGQMSVIVQKCPSKVKGLAQTILMWSCCRLCKQETQVIPMSDSTWKYSFAKYLELTFLSSELHPRADVCPHDIHKDHVRYFGLNNVALRIQYDHVSLYEVTVPRPIVAWKVDSDLKLKNDQYLRIEERLDCFMTSVLARIKCIHPDSVIPEKIEGCRTEVEKMMKRANDEHEWLKRKLQNKYMNSKYYETIPLNRAIRAIQEKAIAWDETFTDFERQFFPSEKDIRRLATLQLKKLFLERDESTSSLASVEEDAEPGLEESIISEKDDSLTLTPMPSNMSPERAHDMLASVVEEDQSLGNKSSDVLNSALIEQKPMLLPPSALPVQSPVEAVERDDVRHLDLAVPSKLPESSLPQDKQLVQTPTQSTDMLQLEPGSPTPVALPKVDPIDQSVAKAIENMPTSPTPAQQPLTNILESKIPRLVDNIRRETPQRPATVVRTQSQPGVILKPTGLPTNNNNVPITLGSEDSLKLSLSDSTRALERMSERLRLNAFKPSKSGSKIPRSVPSGSAKDASKVSKLAEHFEQLSREFQKERMRERRSERSRQVRAYPLASSKPIVEVYRDVHEAVQEHTQSDDDIRNSPNRVSIDNSTLGDSTFTETPIATTASQSPVDERHPRDTINHSHEVEEQHSNPSHPTSDVENEASDVDLAPEDLPLPDSIASSQLLSMTDSQLDSSLELPKHEKTTLMRMLTSFWSERSSSGWSALDYPFAHTEHVWEDSDIIVREDEPSSIIALALSSPDYTTKLHSFRGDASATEKGGIDLEASEASIERNLLHEKNTNIRYSFTNRGVKAQCKIFYAQSFDALRRKCGVADRFVESLSRCSKWDSKGGKSKSIFLKTLDDRFVLKSLSPIEVQAFFRFAPNYFAFTHQNLFKGLPSVIAKMFGLFQVQIKTPTGRDFDWYMLVMENLFYDREPNRRYDLKGSMRNRKIQSTGERDEVLLDENLVDIIYSETPIFVREHTKKLLKASVWNDTLFLSQNNVMDYSLMAGFDDTRREIIVGIIDCIRTYTWDKKLESWIKDRGKNKPTITSPKDYRNRFRIAMEKYILQAPNCWHQFSGRAVVAGGGGVPRRTVVLPGAGGKVQVMEVEGGEVEKAEGSKL